VVFVVGEVTALLTDELLVHDAVGHKVLQVVLTQLHRLLRH